MAILTILEFPDERLRKKARAVTVFDNTLKTLVADMLETMYTAKGVGLAATQVNVALRVIVIDTSEDKTAPLCLINPQLIRTEGDKESEEGCLSVPTFYEKVKRAERVLVSAVDVDGNAFELETGELLAVCIQHEIDHLEGKLFVDYLSSLKRQRIRTKLQKMQRQSA